MYIVFTHVCRECLQMGCHVPFTKEGLPSAHSTMQAWLVDGCGDGCPSGRFFSGHQGLDPSLTKAIGRILPIFELFHWWKMEATVLTGTFKTAEMCLCPSPDLWLKIILSWKLTVLQTVPVTLCLVCALTCNCRTFYRQVCANPNHAQSTEFTITTWIKL